jgi:hypothetical protein
MMRPAAVDELTASPGTPDGLLVENAFVIDGTGAAPQDGVTILVVNGVVDYVGPPTPVTAAWSGARLAGAGRTVVPGLFDLHIHTTLEADMWSYLRNGVTTVRFGGIDSASVSQLRHRLAAACRPMPRILNLGPMLDTAPPSWPQWARVVTDPEDARAVALELLTGEELDGLFFVQGVTTETLRPIVDVAHDHNRPVVGQSWQADGLECAELGVDQLDNTSRIVASRAIPTEELLRPGPVPHRLALLARAWTHVDWDLTMPILETMAAKGVAYCPTFVITNYLAGIGRKDLEEDRDYLRHFDAADHRVFNELADQMNGTWSAEDAYYWKAALDNRYEWVRRFHGLGGVVLPGTDMQYGGIQLHRELANLEACGLSRLEVITAATGAAARAAGLSDSLGLIQEGKRADFVVLHANPLEDLANLREIDLVVQGGMPLSPDQI